LFNEITPAQLKANLDRSIIAAISAMYNEFFHSIYVLDLSATFTFSLC